MIGEDINKFKLLIRFSYLNAKINKLGEVIIFLFLLIKFLAMI